MSSEQTNTYLRNVLRSVPGCVYWKDLNSNYLGCNKVFLDMIGLTHEDEVIGKTDYDFCWHEQAAELRKHDSLVISSGETKTLEEEVTLANGEKKLYAVIKSPLFDENNNIIGIVGTSVDISYRQEIERVEIENQLHKKSLKEQERYTNIAKQLAHDIRSPLASLMMVVKACQTLPEVERATLREAAITISDIANSMLQRFKPGSFEEVAAESQKPITLFMSLLIQQVVYEKTLEYPDVEFQLNISDNMAFACILANKTNIKRLLSNLINNAVEACENCIKPTICISLSQHHGYIKCIISDNGKGIAAKRLRQMNHAVSLNTDKADGYGLGLKQVKDILQARQGSIQFQSMIGQGTDAIITLPKSNLPTWCIDKITLQENDTLLIVEADETMQLLWQQQIHKKINDTHDIQLYFLNTIDELDLHLKQQDNTSLTNVLTIIDFELLITNLEVFKRIESRALVTTEQINDQRLQKKAFNDLLSVVPKQLLTNIPIVIKPQHAEVANSTFANIVILDDNEDYVSNLLFFIFAEQHVDSFHRPEDLLKYADGYEKSTVFFLDNEYDGSSVTGVELASILYHKGFKHIYLLSGRDFDKKELPAFLTAIRKDDIDQINTIIDNKSG